MKAKTIAGIKEIGAWAIITFGIALMLYECAKVEVWR